MRKKEKVISIIRTTTKTEYLSVDHQYKDIDGILLNYNLEETKSIALIGVQDTAVHRTPEFKEIIQLSRGKKIDGIVTSGIDIFIKINNLNRSAILQELADTNLKIFTPDEVINLNSESDYLFGTEN